jgi:3-phytase
MLFVIRHVTLTLERHVFRPIAALLALSVLHGCGAPAEAPAPATPTELAAVEIREAWQTERDTLLDIDSPVVWHGSAGQHWLLVTAKAGDLIRVHDATTGALVRDVGTRGTGLGQYRRPNGVAILGDLLWVVERDGQRVQVLRLPDFTPLGAYGTGDLVKPYGVTVVAREDSVFRTWITDSYELVEDSVPPDSALGRRVREYEVRIRGDQAVATLVRTFGDTGGAGTLRVVESIMADAANDRLMIAEELEGQSQLKVYSLEGRFTGDTVPQRFFPNQAEGIVLYACGDTAGYWIATDQGKVVNTYHLFDRMTLQHVGSFGSPTILNTDGIAITQRAFPGFPAGALFAVHDDGGVAAISWAVIADATGARKDCVQP